jgi:hypothetical protein
MDKEEIIRKVNLALDLFYESDSLLVNLKVNERAICHHFAIYLKLLFQDYNIDCEYDKHGDDFKKLENISECSERKKTDRILPDILVHKRCNDKNNLIILEIKSKSDADSCDIKKLELMTNSKGQFKYDFGVFIKFEKERKNINLRLFIEGEENKIEN